MPETKTGDRTESAGLAGELMRVSEVAGAERDDMFALMQQYYDNIQRHVFDDDFEKKQWVIVARDSVTQKIRGFSTQVVDYFDVDGTTIRILFSGDTIVDQSHWRKNPLAQVWGRLVLTLVDQHPAVDLYWFLITKGYKTYRFLPVFFREFYPRWDRPTADWASKILSNVAIAKFPTAFDSATGVIRANQSSCYLSRGVAELTPQRLADPHVRFFAARNPGHVVGDELCCLAPLSRSNFKPAAYRVIGTETSVAL